MKKTSEADFPFFNGGVAYYEKWAREMLVWKTGPFKRDSPEAWAEGIIRYIEETRSLLGKSAADRAAFAACRLGQFIQRWEEIFIRDRKGQSENILFGVKARLAQQKRGKIRGKNISAGRKSEHNSWRNEAEKIRKRKPGASKSTVAGIIKTRLKSSASVRTIRAII